MDLNDFIGEKSSLDKLFYKIDDLKNEIDQYRPFSKDLLEELKKYYRVGLTYTSNSLEGNSLTMSETKVIIEDGLTVGGKPLKDVYEAIGHSDAYNYIFELINNREIKEDDVKTLHRLFYKHIDINEASKYRNKKVFISGSQYKVANPEDIPEMMTGLLEKMDSTRDKYHPVEFAARLHKEFIFIHPFIDGNGRVARLLMNLALLQDKYTLAIIPPILRHDYIQTLEKAHKNDKDFIAFIAERVIETQKDYLRLFNN